MLLGPQLLTRPRFLLLQAQALLLQYSQHITTQCWILTVARQTNSLLGIEQRRAKFGLQLEQLGLLAGDAFLLPVQVQCAANLGRDAHTWRAASVCAAICSSCCIRRDSLS